MRKTCKESWLNLSQKIIRPGGFVANVGTILAGNVVAQIIGFFSLLVITRLYSPDDFGRLMLISSFIGLFSVIASLRYEISIVLPKTDSRAQNILALCLLIVSGYSLLLMFSVPFLKDYIDIWMNMEGLGNLLWLVPVGVLITGFNSVFNYWYTRKKKYHLLSICRVAASVTTAGIKISAGLLFGSIAFWLIAGNVIGLIIAAAIFGFKFIGEYFYDVRKSISKQKIVDVAKEFNKFPIFNAPTALINSLSQNIPNFLFAFYFSPEVVGFYGLANSILRKPILLLSDAIRKVFLQKVSELQSASKSLRESFVKATLGLVVIGIIPFGGIMVGGEWIFSVFFGKEWSMAGYYSQFLSPWLFLGFINPPATQIILARQKLFFDLNWNITVLFFRALSIIGASFISSEAWVAVALFSTVGVIANLYLMIYAFFLSGTEKL